MVRPVFARAFALTLATFAGLQPCWAGPFEGSVHAVPSTERPVHGAVSARCGGQRPVKKRVTRHHVVRYRCTFSEDFDGSELDREQWVVQQTRFSGLSSGNFDCLVDDPGNVAVSGGMLHLTSREESEEFLCRSPAGDFMTDTTGATIATYRNFAQAHGRFSFRARFPDTRAAGVHSALWLYPAQHTYGRWPLSGEIDVAEWFSNGRTTVLPSLHYGGERWPHSTGWSCGMAQPWKWHTYTVVWKRSVMEFFYDRKSCWRTGWMPDAPLVAPQPFDKPFFVALSQVFGFNDNAVTEATPTSVTMDVNWVRAWE